MKPYDQDSSSSSICPASLMSRHSATARSVSLSQRVVDGQSGRTKIAQRAMKTVIEPSIMKSQRQASRPWAPSRELWIPAPMRPENALPSWLPEKRKALRVPSSERVYHDESRNKAPAEIMCQYALLVSIFVRWYLR